MQDVLSQLSMHHAGQVGAGVDERAGLDVAVEGDAERAEPRAVARLRLILFAGVPDLEPDHDELIHLIVDQLLHPVDAVLLHGSSIRHSAPATSGCCG